MVDIREVRGKYQTIRHEITNIFNVHDSGQAWGCLNNSPARLFLSGQKLIGSCMHYKPASLHHNLKTVHIFPTKDRLHGKAALWLSYIHEGGKKWGDHSSLHLLYCSSLCAHNF